MVKTIKVEALNAKTELNTILRWEDDGGMIVEADSSSTRERRLIRSIRPSGHTRSWFRRFPKKGATQ